MATSYDIQKRIIELLSDNNEHSIQEMKTDLSSMGIVDYSEGQFSGSINTLVKNGTIRKMGRGVYKYNDGTEEKRNCFVVSAIGDPDSDVRKASDQVFKYIIKPVCDETGFNPIRVDQLDQSDVITETIIAYLRDSDLVIADISGLNPNVFYEMGYRSAIGKPIIYLKKNDEKIPFDIAAIRTFDYDRNDLDSVAEVKNRLKNTIETMAFDNEEGYGKNDASGKEMVSDSGTLVSILYEIKDEITGLKETINKKDSETIRTIIEASSKPAVVEDPQTALMKAVLPELFKNPQTIPMIMKFSQEAKKDIQE